MRGGWRYNAGRPAWHAKTSQALRLDVRELKRRDWLQRGAVCNLQWKSGASIGYTVTDDGGAIVLRYRFTFSDGRRDIEQRVGIQRTPCNYGGERPWFLCPRCWNRVAIIYLHGWPMCRKCARLAYPWQSDATRMSAAGGQRASSRDVWPATRNRGTTAARRACDARPSSDCSGLWAGRGIRCAGNIHGSARLVAAVTTHCT